MQPPPPPLNIAQLKTLVAQADLIIVGRIKAVQEAEGTVGATVCIEKLLKGKAAGKTIEIKETYKPASFQKPSPESKIEADPSKAIVASIAGPATYHGKYRKDGRIIVLLGKIEGTGNYRPLGSGTYDKHLCVFPIENRGIQTFYFRFGEDVEKFAEDEDRFVCFVRKTIKSYSENRK